MSEVLITAVPYDWIMMLQKDASLNTGSLHTAAVDGTIMIFMCFLRMNYVIYTNFIWIQIRQKLYAIIMIKFKDRK